MSDIQKARAMLVRALEDFGHFERGTYGYRDAIYKHIPNAIEAMIDAALKERVSSFLNQDQAG